MQGHTTIKKSHT